MLPKTAFAASRPPDEDGDVAVFTPSLSADCARWRFPSFV